MANTGKWIAGASAPGSPTTVLSTELNSLANNTMSSASTTVVANQTNLDIYADIELVLASFTPGSNPYVTIYILEAIDSTNYPTASAVLRNQPSQVLCSIPLDTSAATAQRIVVRNVLLPPGSFKLALDNQSGQAIAASGNTVKIITYNYNLNG